MKWGKTLPGSIDLIHQNGMHLPRPKEAETPCISRPVPLALGTHSSPGQSSLIADWLPVIHGSNWYSQTVSPSSSSLNSYDDYQLMWVPWFIHTLQVRRLFGGSKWHSESELYPNTTVYFALSLFVLWSFPIQPRAEDTQRLHVWHCFSNNNAKVLLAKQLQL